MSLIQPLEDAVERAPQLQNIAQAMNSKGLPVEDAIVKAMKQTVSLPEEKFDYNYQFKKLLPSVIARLNKNYINTNNKLSGVLYTTGLAFGKSTKFSLDKIRTLSSYIYIASAAAKSGLEKTQELVVLVGQKAQVLKGKEKIEKNLKEVGISFDNVMVNKSYIESDYEKINNYLKAQSVKMGFEENISLEDKDSYNLSVLKNPEVPQSIKKEIIEKVVWVKIKHEIQQSMSLTAVAVNLQAVDPYIKQSTQVAKENNITTDSLLVMLAHSPRMLQQLKNGHKIVASSEKILEATQKYNDFLNSANYISSFYINLAKHAFHKYLSAEDYNNIMEEKILLLGQEDLNLKEIDERLTGVGFIDQFSVKSPESEKELLDKAHPTM